MNSTETVLAQTKTASDSRDFVGAYRLLSQAYQGAATAALAAWSGALGGGGEQALGRRICGDACWPIQLGQPGPQRRKPWSSCCACRSRQLPRSAWGSRGSVELDGRVVGIAPLSAPLLVRTGRHRVAVTLGRWRAGTEVTARTARLSELRFKRARMRSL